MQKWNQTVFKWNQAEPYPEIDVKIVNTQRHYIMAGLAIQASKQPSNTMEIELDIWEGRNKGSAINRMDCALIQQKVLGVIGAMTYLMDTPVIGVRDMMRILRSGESFCDVAIETAQSIFQALGIHDSTGMLISNFQLIQVTRVRKSGQKGQPPQWITLAEHLIEKHKLVRG